MLNLAVGRGTCFLSGHPRDKEGMRLEREQMCSENKGSVRSGFACVETIDPYKIEEYAPVSFLW